MLSNIEYHNQRLIIPTRAAAPEVDLAEQKSSHSITTTTTIFVGLLIMDSIVVASSGTLVYSVDGLEGTEASAAWKCLTLYLQPSGVDGFICSHISLTLLVCLMSRCLSGTGSPGLHHYRPLDLDLVTGAGIDLYQA